jgi:tetratricopeptide (TPR) repeat protein
MLLTTYYDGQVEVNCRGDQDNYLSIQEIISIVIKRCSLDVSSLPSDSDELRHLYYSTINSGRFIIFFDNLNNLDQISGLTNSQNPLFLITSRKYLYLPKSITIELLDFEEDEALNYSKSNLPNFEKIKNYDVFPKHPLTLEHFTNLVANNLIFIDEFDYWLKLLQQAKTPYFEIINITLNKIDESTKKIFLYSSLFRSSFDLQSLSVITQQEPSYVIKYLNNLIKLSLIRQRDSSNDFEIHDLTREYLESTMHDDIPYHIKYNFANFSKNLLYFREGVEYYEKYELINKMDENWLNIKSSFDWLIKHSNEDEAMFNLALNFISLNDFGLKYRHPSDRIYIAKNILSLDKIKLLEISEMQTQLFLGYAYADISDINSAIHHFLSVVNLSLQVNDESYEAVAYSNIGGCYRFLGKLEESLKFLDMAIEKSKSFKDLSTKASALGNRGLVLTDLGKINEAILNYEEQLKISIEIEDLENKRNAFGSLGFAQIYLPDGDPLKAIDYFIKWREVAILTFNKRAEGDACTGLALAYMKLNDLYQAEEFAQKHVVIAKSVGDKRGQGAALGTLGCIYEKQNKYEKAIACFQEHVDIAKNIPDRRGEAYSSWNIGEVYVKINMPEKAILYFDVTLEYERSIDHSDYTWRNSYVNKIKEKHG